MISEVLTGIGEGIASILPAFAKAVFDAFVSLFLVSTTGSGSAVTYSLNPLGEVAIALMCLALAKKYLPAVANFLSVRIAAARKRRAKARA